MKIYSICSYLTIVGIINKATTFVEKGNIAACGAACGICYLLNYPHRVLYDTITNTIATVGGMVCDGAKSSCAAKISTALQTALLGMKMGLHNCTFQPGEGLVEEDVEKTIRSIGRMGREGMKATDNEILKIMLGD